MKRHPKVFIARIGLYLALVASSVAFATSETRAALSDSERQRIEDLAREWGDIAQVEGPIAEDPRLGGQAPDAIERALAGASIGDAVVNIVSRRPAELANAVSTAVVAAPALSEPIVARVSRAYPVQTAEIVAAAAAARSGEAQAEPAMTATPSVEPQPASNEVGEVTVAEQATGERDRYAEIEAALYAQNDDENEPDELHDPYEPVNRFIFAFNDLLDTIVFRPLAAIYSFVAPDGVKIAMRQFYRNLNEPVVFANKLLQFEGEEALITLGRFAVNTTLGAGGFFEVAEDWDMPPQSADFGQTLAGWGVPRGSYIVAPIVGPNNARLGVGRIVDLAFDPRTWLLPMPVNGGLTAGYAVVLREQLIEPLDQLRAGSIDYYTAIKSAFWQNRQRTLRGEQHGGEFSVGEEDLDAEFDKIE